MYRFPYLIRNKDILIKSKERKEIKEKYFLKFPYFMRNQRFRIFSKMKGSRGN